MNDDRQGNRNKSEDKWGQIEWWTAYSPLNRTVFSTNELTSSQLQRWQPEEKMHLAKKQLKHLAYTESV